MNQFQKNGMLNKIWSFLIILLLVFFLGTYLVYQTHLDNTFQVVCLDAGKADALLLLSKNSTVVIDTGLDESGEKIVSYLEEQNRVNIDYLIITHFDKDHVGGADTVIKERNVKQVVQSTFWKDSDDTKEYNKALEKKNITPDKLTEELDFTLDGVEYQIDPPKKQSYEDKESNNSSLIVSVTYGKNRFLFMGDAETERLQEFLNENPSSYDFLKVPYHGHYQTLLPKLLQEVKPSVSVITSSMEEPEDEETVEALNGIGSSVYLTREGTVTVTSSGRTLKVN